MMKKFIYGTIFLFVSILIVVMIIAVNIPVEEVHYEDGVIVEGR